MKKVFSIVISLLLFFWVSVSSSATKTKSIDDLLVPYQIAISRVNSDLGSSYFIPNNNKKQVFDNIQSKTPQEFEDMLRQEYKTYSLDPEYRTELSSGDYT